jgi:transposase
MAMLAERVDAVIGADTHRDTHALEMAAPAGVPIAALTVPNSAAGFAAALAWIADHAPGPRLVAALEGTRSYGIGLARALDAAGLTVVEVECPRRRGRRRGKSDPIDAHLAATAALALDAAKLPVPRADGDREALRILLGARRDLTRTRTRQVNALRALLRGGDDTDRDLARGRLPAATLTALARRRGRADDTVETTVRRAEVRRLARATAAAGRELADNRRQLATLVQTMAPGLQDRRGLGPVDAAQILVSWSHPGRCHSDAAFAALAGVCPVPASSGHTVRNRLNRGGDRALNRALHDIALTRCRCDPRTRAYLARRRAEGKTDREIRRCLTRYIARELFRTLETTTP